MFPCIEGINIITEDKFLIWLKDKKRGANYCCFGMNKKMRYSYDMNADKFWFNKMLNT